MSFRTPGVLAHGRSVAVAGAILAAASAAPALAQSIDGLGIPSEFLNDSQIRPGDQIAYCYDPTSDLAELDRRVGQAIADRLLVRATFFELLPQGDIYGQFFLETMYMSLINECDVVVGMALAANSYPDWLTITRPYASFTYVLAVTNPEYTGLSSIPPGRLIGTQVTSLGELSFAQYNSLRAPDQRWRPLPYGDLALMMTRLRDGTIGGAILFEPTLEAMTDRAEANDVRGLPLNEVANLQVRIGGVMFADNVFLRTQIDQAIDSLVADGSIASLLTELDIPGAAGEDR